jgi:hypothetical protein
MQLSNGVYQTEILLAVEDGGLDTLSCHDEGIREAKVVI